MTSVLKMVCRITATTVIQSSDRPVLDEHGRTEQELAAADRGAEHDDSGADDAEPCEPGGRWRHRQRGRSPGIKA